MTPTETTLKSILRLFGTASLSALIFVAVPYSWMNEIHVALGLGTLPEEPIVGYLARSTSAFYALIGGLFWLVSFDLARYRQVVIFLGCAVALFGLALLVIDWAEGLPLLWRVWEGPIVIVMGLALALLARRIDPDGLERR